MPTNAAMIAANEKRVAAAKLNPDKIAAFRATARRLHDNKPVFEQLSSKTGVPWAIIAVIKEREAGADPKFQLSIAQGDPWNRVSVHVPRGRGPFTSWLLAGIDALVKCAPYASLWHDWSAGGSMTILIKYNGIGYDSRGLPSPYGYAGTNQYVRGKYVADGVYDPNAVDQQLGCLGMLLALQEIDPTAAFGSPVASPRPTPTPPKDIIDEATKKEKQVRTGSAAAGTVAGTAKATTEAPSHPFIHSVVSYSVIGIAVVLFVATTIIIGRKVKAITDIW